MLQKVLNELFHFFRFESCQHVGQALNVVLESMDRHIMERHIQISGRYNTLKNKKIVNLNTVF